MSFNSFFSGLGLVFCLYSCNKPHKIGYVNTQVMFNDFAYKQELEKELTSIKNSRKFIIDSLEANLKILLKQIKSDQKNRDLLIDFQNQKDLFLAKKQRFSEDEEVMVKQYDEKIINQLNEYAKDFGRENKFDIIYGANSSGNIMYADSVYDITKEVVAYMNQKFSGKK